MLRKTHRAFVKIPNPYNQKPYDGNRESAEVGRSSWMLKALKVGFHETRVGDRVSVF